MDRRFNLLGMGIAAICVALFISESVSANCEVSSYKVRVPDEINCREGKFSLKNSNEQLLIHKAMLGPRSDPTEQQQFARGQGPAAPESAFFKTCKKLKKNVKTYLHCAQGSPAAYDLLQPCPADVPECR